MDTCEHTQWCFRHVLAHNDSHRVLTHPSAGVFNLLELKAQGPPPRIDDRILVHSTTCLDESKFIVFRVFTLSPHLLEL